MIMQASLENFHDFSQNSWKFCAEFLENSLENWAIFSRFCYFTMLYQRLLSISNRYRFTLLSLIQKTLDNHKTLCMRKFLEKNTTS